MARALANILSSWNPFQVRFRCLLFESYYPLLFKKNRQMALARLTMQGIVLVDESGSLSTTFLHVHLLELVRLLFK